MVRPTPRHDGSRPECSAARSPDSKNPDRGDQPTSQTAPASATRRRFRCADRFVFLIRARQPINGGEKSGRITAKVCMAGRSKWSRHARASAFNKRVESPALPLAGSHRSAIDTLVTITRVAPMRAHSRSSAADRRSPFRRGCLPTV